MEVTLADAQLVANLSYPADAAQLWVVVQLFAQSDVSETTVTLEEVALYDGEVADEKRLLTLEMGLPDDFDPVFTAPLEQRSLMLDDLGVTTSGDLAPLCGQTALLSVTFRGSACDCTERDTAQVTIECLPDLRALEHLEPERGAPPSDMPCEALTYFLFRRPR